MDFTDFETTDGGIWRIGGVCDYWAKPALAARVAATAMATDLIAALEPPSPPPKSCSGTH